MSKGLLRTKGYRVGENRPIIAFTFGRANFDLNSCTAAVSVRAIVSEVRSPVSLSDRDRARPGGKKERRMKGTKKALEKEGMPTKSVLVGFTARQAIQEGETLNKIGRLRKSSWVNRKRTGRSIKGKRRGRKNKRTSDQTF
jgi:hypothetical protein